jgi:hypothetical protein
MKWAILSGLLLTACATRVIDSRFQPVEHPTEEIVARSISEAEPRVERPVLVGLLAEQPALAMWDLSSNASWTRPVEALSTPIIAGNTIVMQERDGVVVRDLATGAVRVVASKAGRLVGADGVGDKVAITVSNGTDHPPALVILVDGKSVRFREQLHLPAGRPAVVGSYVLVPWATQRLSALSIADGAEVARFAFTNMIVGTAKVEPGVVLIGQQGFLPITPDLRNRTSGPAALYAPLKRNLPGQPPLLRDGYELAPEPDNAKNRFAVDFHVVSANGALRAEEDLLALRFYRVLLGLEADKDELRFLRRFEADLVAAQVVTGGVLTTDANGTLRALGTNGHTISTRELGKKLRAAVLRAQSLPSVGMQAAAPGESVSLRDELLATVRLDDAQLVPLRAWAAERLVSVDDPSVTGELVALCEDHGLPELVRGKSCDALAQRADGGNEVLVALRRRGSFLEATKAPPVGSLAQTAVRMNLRQAGPLLVSHLEDANTRVDEIASVCNALATLDHKPAATVIERFVRIHHAEPAGTDLTPALLAAIDALGSLRVKTTRETLVLVANDALSTEAIRSQARSALGVIDSPIKATEKGEDKAKVVAAPPAVAESSEEIETDPRTWSLSAEAVMAPFKRMRPALLRCLANDPSGVKSARISLVITGAGSVDGSFVTPTTLQGCMDPILRSARFPETRVGRQHVTHTLRP